MRKLFLFFAYSLFISTISCLGMEGLQKQTDKSSHKDMVDKKHQSFKKTLHPVQGTKIKSNTQDKMNSTQLELAKQEQEKKKKLTPKKVSKSLFYTVLMYIPNRLIDFTDIVSMELGFGPEASCELTATRYCQFGAAYGDRYFLEKGYNRQYGGGYYSGYNAAFVCWNDEIALNDYTFGTVEPYVIMGNDSGVQCLSKKPYSEGIRDFWKIGFHVGWIVDIGASIHPVAVANFFTGFFFVRLTDTKEM
jgi:hypothetical protein